MCGKIYYKKDDVSLRLIFAIAMIVLTHAVSNVFSVGSEGLSSYASYLMWGFLVLYFLKIKSTFEKKMIAMAICLAVSEAIGVALAACNGLSTIYDVHQWFIFMVCMLVILSIPSNIKVSQWQVERVMKAIVLMGMVASLYAMIVQRDQWVCVLLGISPSINSWQYVSFFSQRNIFAVFCFLCSIPAVYLLLQKGAFRYLFATGILAFQIYITNSRGALVALLLFFGLLFYFRTKKKIALLFCVVCFSIFWASFFSINFMSILENYIHIDTATGEDSFFSRLSMWQQGVEYLISSKAILTGLGFGAASQFLSSQYGFGSFHSAYMDLLFDGGLIMLIAYLSALVKLFQRMLRNQNETLKVVLTAGFISYCFYSLIESGSMLFSARDQAVLVTTLFGIIPVFSLISEGQAVQDKERLSK